MNTSKASSSLIQNEDLNVPPDQYSNVADSQTLLAREHDIQFLLQETVKEKDLEIEFLKSKLKEISIVQQAPVDSEHTLLNECNISQSLSSIDQVEEGEDENKRNDPQGE